MSVQTLRRRQVIPCDIGEVFAFFDDPHNLETITPPWLSFEITALDDERVREGTLIDYRLRWQGLPMSWRTRIAEHRPGEYFADEMIRGPYRRWYHRHFFREVEGGVEMSDEVEYELPLGPLGAFVHAVVVRRQLEAIFDFRRDTIFKLFGAPTVKSRTTR